MAGSWRIGDPPVFERLVDETGLLTTVWAEYLQNLTLLDSLKDIVEQGTGGYGVQVSTDPFRPGLATTSEAPVSSSSLAPASKSYSFTSRGVTAGTYYAAGFYEAPAADANLTQASTTQILGGTNVPYAAHAFAVAGGAGAASGGNGAVTLVASGTSITDAGVRTESDSEVLVADITQMSTDDYVETDKKWLGQVTYTLTVGSTGHTTYNFDFNYGYCKYDDLGNRNFTLTDFEVVGTAAANSTWNVELLHHKTTGWTYHATAFVPGAAALLDADAIHSTENDLDNTEPFAFKRAGLSQAIAGAGSEGFLIRITTGANNTVQFMDMHVKATF